MPVQCWIPGWSEVRMNSGYWLGNKMRNPEFLYKCLAQKMCTVWKHDMIQWISNATDNYALRAPLKKFGSLHSINTPIDAIMVICCFGAMMTKIMGSLVVDYFELLQYLQKKSCQMFLTMTEYSKHMYLLEIFVRDKWKAEPMTTFTSAR